MPARRGNVNGARWVCTHFATASATTQRRGLTFLDYLPSAWVMIPGAAQCVHQFPTLFRQETPAG